MPDHVTGHVVGHVTGQTRFGHVTFPRSRASEVPESQFVTLEPFVHIGVWKIGAFDILGIGGNPTK